MTKLQALQNFYKTTVAVAWGTGTGTVYVTELPTPTAGRLTINPSNASLREIVSYSGIGTDGTGNYIVLTARGVGGTSANTHQINEPVRMNMTAENWNDVDVVLTDMQDQIDTLVLQNAPNASTTTRGIVLMSTAPSEAGTAIVVATTDPKYSKIDDIPDHFVSVSTGAGDSGSGVVLNGSGQVDITAIPTLTRAKYLRGSYIEKIDTTDYNLYTNTANFISHQLTTPLTSTGGLKTRFYFSRDAGADGNAYFDIQLNNTTLVSVTVPQSVDAGATRGHYELYVQNLTSSTQTVAYHYVIEQFDSTYNYRPTSRGGGTTTKNISTGTTDTITFDATFDNSGQDDEDLNINGLVIEQFD